MPCPEQCAWGGVAKRRLARVIGHRLAAWTVARCWPLVVAYTRSVYTRLARRVARDIADYARSGFSVAGIVGVDGSPSCGVTKTLDARRLVPRLGRLSPVATSSDVNAEVTSAIADGVGWFTKALQRELAARQLSVRWHAYDLPAELTGRERSMDL
jgi:hypothetical protein